MFCNCMGRRGFSLFSSHRVVYIPSRDGVTFPSTLLSIPQPQRRFIFLIGRKLTKNSNWVNHPSHKCDVTYCKTPNLLILLLKSSLNLTNLPMLSSCSTESSRGVSTKAGHNVLIRTLQSPSEDASYKNMCKVVWRTSHSTLFTVCVSICVCVLPPQLQ